MILTMLLVGCSGSGSSDSSTITSNNKVSGTVGLFLAKTHNSTCILRSQDRTITTLTTNEDGIAKFSNLEISPGIVTLTCNGGQYIDEASGELTTLTQPIRAAMNYTGDELQLISSPISEIAYQRALLNDDLSNVDNYNNATAKKMGYANDGFVSVIPIDLNKEIANNNANGHVAIILSALSQISQDHFEKNLGKMLTTLVDYHKQSTNTSPKPEYDISNAIDNLLQSTKTNASKNLLQSHSARVEIANQESRFQNSTTVLATEVNLIGNDRFDLSEIGHLAYKVQPTNVSENSVKWLSSIPGIATISSQTGQITPQKPGFTTISITTLDGSNRTAEKRIQIGKKPQLITTSPLSFEYSAKNITYVFSNNGGDVTQCSVNSSMSNSLTITPSNGSCQLTIKGKVESQSEISIQAINAFGAQNLKQTLQITPKSITVKADAKNKTYDGDDPALTYQVDGLLSGDTLTGNLSRETGENVGTYNITQGSLSNANYALQFTQANFSIHPKPITVTAHATGKTYGDDDPKLTYTVTGLLNNDALSGALARATGENTGGYEITQNSLASGANYTIQFTTANFNINPKAITVTAHAINKTYGDDDPALTYQVDGLLSGDTLTGNLSRETGENVGTYNITQGSLSNANYALQFTQAKFSIHPKPITVTAHATSKTYGDDDPKLTYTVIGLLNNDALSGALVRATGENTGGYEITQNSLVSGANYTIQFTTANFNINPKAITVTAHKISKAYGDDDPELTYTATGLLNDDSLNGTLTRTLGEESTTYTILIGSLSNVNYQISFVSAVFTIHPSIAEYKESSPSFAKSAYIGKVLQFNESSASLVFTDDGHPYLINNHHAFLSTYTQVVSYNTKNTNFLIARLSGKMSDLFEIKGDERTMVSGGDDDIKQITLDDLGITDSKVFIYASQDVEINVSDFPKRVQNWFKDSGDISGTLKIQKGLSMHTEMEINDIPGVATALDFVLLEAPSRNAQINVPINLATTLYHPDQDKTTLSDFEIKYAFPESGVYFGENYVIKHTINNLESPLKAELTLQIQRNKDNLSISIIDNDFQFPLLTSDIATIGMKYAINIITDQISEDSGRAFLNLSNNTEYKLFKQNWLTVPKNQFNILINLTDAVPHDFAMKFITDLPFLADKFISLNTTVEFNYVSTFASASLPVPNVGFVIHNGKGEMGSMELSYVPKLMQEIIRQYSPSFDMELDKLPQIPEPIAYKGVLGEGQTIESYQIENGHPPGPKFNITPMTTFPFIKELEFQSTIELFEVEFAEVESMSISVLDQEFLSVSAKAADFELDDVKLDTELRLSIATPSLGDIIKGALNTGADTIITEADFIAGVSAASDEIVAAFTDIAANLYAQAELLTVGGSYASTITLLTRSDEVTGKFGGTAATVGANYSLEPWDPSSGFNILFENKDLLSQATAAITTGFNDELNNIDTITDDIDARIAELEDDLAVAASNYNAIYQRAEENKRKTEQGLKDAESDVRKAREDLKSYDYHAYYKFSSKRYCVLDICTPSARDLAYVPWKAGRYVYTGALWLAEKTLEGLRATVNFYPISAYPEVILAQAKIDAVQFALNTVEATKNTLENIKNGLKAALQEVINTFTQGFKVNNFELYGELGLAGGIGIKGSVTILGKTYNFDKSLDYDITHIRDTFTQILYDYIWEPVIDAITFDKTKDEVDSYNSDNSIATAPPTGSIANQVFWQDNSTNNNSFSMNLLDYITDTADDELTFSASGLPKRFKLTESGSLKGEYTEHEIGVHLIEVTVTDLTYRQLVTTFSITVNGRNATHTVKIFSDYAYEDFVSSSATEQKSTDSLTQETSVVQIPGNATVEEFTDFAYVAVEDLDVGTTYTYAITTGNNSNHFSIDNEGNISLTEAGESSLTTAYDLTISVTDNSARIPSNLTTTTHLTINIRPVVWLEKLTTITSKTPEFIIRIHPLPNDKTSVAYQVHYQVESPPLATDNLDHSLSYEAIYEIKSELDFSNSRFGLLDNHPIKIRINPLQRHADRDYKISLINVYGNATIDESQKQQETIMYALSPQIIGSIAELNDTGIQQWGDANHNNLQKDQTDVKQQDADVGFDAESINNIGFNFSMLDVKGEVTTNNSDMACILDSRTNLRWVKPARAFQKLKNTGLYVNNYGGDPDTNHPLKNTKSYQPTENLSILLNSQPLDHHYNYLYGAAVETIFYWVDQNDDFSSVAYEDKIYTEHSYCIKDSRSAFHIPTVKQLQGLINYSKNGNSLLDSNFFSDTTGTHYLAVGLDFPQISRAEKSDFSSLSRPTLKQLINPQENEPDHVGNLELSTWLFEQANENDWILNSSSSYVQTLKNEISNSTPVSSIIIPREDTSEPMKKELESAKNILAKLLYSVNISTGEVTPVNSDTIDFRLTEVNGDYGDSYQISPHFKGNIIWISDTNQNALFSQMIEAFFTIK